MLFELLTGQKPFEGVNFAMLFEQHLHKKAPRVIDFVPDCPEPLSDIIDSLLEKDPDKRPFNARAVQGVLSELLASHGLKTSGVPVADGSTDDVAAANVVEQEVIDPGMSSLKRKIQPETRPEASWKFLAILAAGVAVVLAIAATQGD